MRPSTSGIPFIIRVRNLKFSFGLLSLSAVESITPWAVYYPSSTSWKAKCEVDKVLCTNFSDRQYLPVSTAKPSSELTNPRRARPAPPVLREWCVVDPKPIIIETRAVTNQNIFVFFTEPHGQQGAHANGQGFYDDSTKIWCLEKDSCAILGHSIGDRVSNHG